MRIGRCFWLLCAFAAFSFLGVWAGQFSSVSSASAAPANTLPEYVPGVPHNQVNPYEGFTSSSVGISAVPGADVNVSKLVGNESEVSIDINPTNPDNQVIVGHAPDFKTMNTFFTLNGGQTWTLVPLGDAEDGMTGRTGVAARFDPTVAFDNNGNVYVGYGVRRTFDATTVVVAKSTDGGQTYTQFTRVDTSPDIDGSPGNDKWHLATGPDPSVASQQNVYVAWTQNVEGLFGIGVDKRVLLSASTDGGAIFSIPVEVNDPSLLNRRALFADPAVGPNGELYVAWYDINSGEVFTDVSLNGGATFGPDTLVVTSAAGFKTSIPSQPDRGVFVGPTIDTDRSGGEFDGRLYITYTDVGAAGLPDTDIFVQFSDDMGTNWSEPTRVNDNLVNCGANSQFLPWLDVDQKTGLVGVVWYDARNDPDNQTVEALMAVSNDGAVSFQADILVSDGKSDQSENNADRTPNNFLEYIGLALSDSVAYPVWSDNSTVAANLDLFTTQIPVSIPEGSAADVFIIVDLSGSFADDLPNFKTQAPDIISVLQASNPNIRFGLAKFEDYPISPFGSSGAGDKAYERLVDLTFDTDLVLDKIDGLFTRSGGDGPQSQLPALFQAAAGAGQDLSGVGFAEASIPACQQANFREDASTKLFVLWTDAPFHDPGDPGTIPYPGPSFGDTVDAILALDPPQVIGISSGGFGIEDLEAIAAATGGVAPSGGVDCNGDAIIDIFEGEPLVCPISFSGAGIGDAIVALVGATLAIPVVIDIKPNKEPNPVNLKSKDVIPMAILTTDTFDATTVDPLSVQFGPNGATEPHGRGHIKDVDEDGDLDLLLHFAVQETGIVCGDTSASLTGQTFGGQAIQGSDSIKTVGCK